MRCEITDSIFHQRYEFNFLDDKSKSFITWIIPLFKAEFYEATESVYSEGDGIHNIYFLHTGVAYFVLPIVHNHPYIEIDPKDHFGVIDIIGS